MDELIELVPVENELRTARAAIEAPVRYQRSARSGIDTTPPLPSTAVTRPRTPPTIVALATTLGLAALCWVVALRQMSGMDMGVATQLGSFPSFIAMWVPMMGAMMLPVAGPAVLRCVRASGRVRDMPLFVGWYMVVWTLVGVAVYVLYRPHGANAAGAIVIAAGVYELSPLKLHFRRRRGESIRSGFEYGLCCVGASIGLMVVLVALGPMSVTWMCVIAVPVIVQRIVRPRSSIDVPLALVVIGFGILVIVAPSSVPGLVLPM